MLNILAKQIIVSPDGEMIGHELHSPFTYLTTLVGDKRTNGANGRGSELSGFEPLDDEVERFLASLRFEQRDKLAQLPFDLNSEL